MKQSTDFVGAFLAGRVGESEILSELERLQNSDPENAARNFGEILSKIFALQEVTRRVSETLSLDSLLLTIIDITTAATRADRGTLFLNDASDQTLFSRVQHGECQSEIRIPNALGIAGAVFSSGQAEIIAKPYDDPRFNTDIDRETNYTTENILCAPIKTRRGEVIGVVQMLNKRGGAFDASDLSLLEAITTQASSALQNAALFEEVSRARREETLLLEVTTAISRELQLLPLLEKIMAACNQLMHANRSTVFLYDENTDELWSQVRADDQTREIRFSASRGIAGSALKKRQTINIADAYSDQRFNQEIDRRTGYTTRTILCMPIINKEDQPIGVFQVLNKEGGPFTSHDEKLLRAFSAQASIAIENSRLFNDVLNMKNYNESILQSLSNGVITLDANGVVEKCNLAALKILAIEEQQIIERPSSELFTGENSWVSESIRGALNERETDVALDTTIAIYGENRATVNVTTVPLFDVEHEPIGAMLVLEDITKEKRLKSTMARYMTREVAEKLLESGEDSLGGKAHQATVFFSDIRDFTAISESIGAQATVSMLNDYFTIMVDVILGRGGILDKYIGDSIMAVFGAPFASGDDADRAVASAVGMMRALSAFNAERLASGQVEVGMKIGINTDEIISGNIGSPRRMDYTVIGDGVNLAARLEGANKYYGSNILISEFTQRELRESYLLREVDCIRVKGKTQPVAVYEVLDYHTDESFPHLGEVTRLFAEALATYRELRFGASALIFKKALLLNPTDKLSQLYLKRCQHLMETPPDSDWDGVWSLSEK